ncbi:MAG: Nif3-like dinuclear metal center hexameric protein [Acidothermus sp.]|nr:Nif3-like dinuclear metal center hexameric protein [Acidothermus sp.]
MTARDAAETPPAPPTLRDVVAVLNQLYPPALAAEWDAVGLVCGEPSQAVRRILFAVDPVPSVAAEAIERGVDLLVTHHPLYLRGTSSVAATTAKGRVVHELIRAGIALFTAHTNADHASPGVSDALAAALGVTELRPLDPLPAQPTDKLVTFAPADAVERILDALSAAGAGAIGAYSRCAWTTDGIGTFRPNPGAHPTIGTIGRIETVPEVRVEMVLPRARRDAVIAALLAAHPYEEPAYDVIPLAERPGRAGTGRIGRLDQPESLADFVDRVRAALPATPGGGRYAGDPDRLVHIVAVCGGAGDGYLQTAAGAGADVYVTADLRHHPASEITAETGIALVDMPHWATEWPWLPDAAARLREALGAAGFTVNIEVSTLVTDPWDGRIPGGGSR